MSKTKSALDYMSLNEVAAEIHRNAADHGWWEKERQLPEILALCHSELSEALEEYRCGRPMAYALRLTEELDRLDYFEEDIAKWAPEDKPEGIATELVDCMIRILDYLAHVGVDIDAILRAKHKYNVTRPYRHGNKTC